MAWFLRQSGLRFRAAWICLFIIAWTTPAFCDFTLVVLPDTQTYAVYHPDVFTIQTQWIAANKRGWNIAVVLHEGDIVEHPTYLSEWENAHQSMSVLDGIVPYTMAVGNHDMGTDDENPSNNRNTAYFNSYFPVSRFECHPWYGGHRGDDNDDHFLLFTADGMDFMIVTLEFGPDDEMLAWADEIIASRPNRRVIILTHCYMNSDDTRIGGEDIGSPYAYGIADTGTNDGEQVWNKLVKNHPNIFLVLSGHIHGSTISMCAGKLTSVGVYGNTVHQLLADYQSYDSDGGWLRTLTFVPDEDRILVDTYSPVFDEYMTDADNSFELAYPMPDSPVGCCCLSDGNSMVAKESDCLALEDGVYLGDGTTCDGTACQACAQGLLVPPAAASDSSPKNRYISFETGNPGQMTAISVTLTNSAIFPELVGWQQWVGTPVGDVAPLLSAPKCRDWGAGNVVHVTAPMIIPQATYDIEAVDCGCLSDYSESLTIATSFKWGDVAGLTDAGWTPPDGRVDFNDIMAVVEKFRSLPNAPSLQACDLVPERPDAVVDFQDISVCVDAFRNYPYLYDMKIVCR